MEEIQKKVRGWVGQTDNRKLSDSTVGKPTELIILCRRTYDQRPTTNDQRMNKESDARISTIKHW